MAVPRVELTLTEFQEGYCDGYIREVVTLKIGTEWRLYGKDPRGMANDPQYRYKIVWCAMP